MNAKEEAIDEEKAGQESAAGRTTSPPSYAIRIRDCFGGLKG